MYWGWLEMETANCLLETAACWAALASLSPQTPSSHPDIFSLSQTNPSTTGQRQIWVSGLSSPAHSLTHIKCCN